MCQQKMYLNQETPLNIMKKNQSRMASRRMPPPPMVVVTSLVQGSMYGCGVLNLRELQAAIGSQQP